MASGGVNKVILIGNLGRDPEIRYTTNGTAVVNLSLATTRRYKGRDGQQQEETEWHRVVMFSRLAEIAGEYLRKGSQVYIEGRLQTRSYEKDGVTRYSTEIVANEMQMLGGGGGRGGGGGGGAWDQSAPADFDQSPPQGGGSSGGGQPDFDQDFEDDIPF